MMKEDKEIMKWLKPEWFFQVNEISPESPSTVSSVDTPSPTFRIKPVVQPTIPTPTIAAAAAVSRKQRLSRSSSTTAPTGDDAPTTPATASPTVLPAVSSALKVPAAVKQPECGLVGKAMVVISADGLNFKNEIPDAASSVARQVIF